MNTKISKVLIGSASALALQLPAGATDLDLYVNNVTGAVTADLPNVLFVIDNTANWSKPFGIEKAALVATLKNLPENKFNIGIMFGSETGKGADGNEGGYMRAAIRPMNAINKPLYQALVNSLDVTADKANGGTSSLQMAEAYFYFSGGQAYASAGKVKTDFLGSLNTPVHALPGNALSSKFAARYNSPVVAGSCAKNYIIYLSNGPAQANSSQNLVAKNMLIDAAGGGAAGAAAAATIGLRNTSSQSDVSDEWTRFMKKSSLQVTTYTIEVNPSPQNAGEGWTDLLKSMSGPGNYAAVSIKDGTNPQVLTDIINEALSKIQSVNSVFAAVSLPASASVEGSYLNQLYIGMFRPDADAKPRWMGNLKQYKIGTDKTLADADNKSAINTGTGFIAECARSFWTPPRDKKDTYWIDDPRGKCIVAGEVPTLNAISNTPDGNIVEKGAQAYLTREGTVAARKIFTCSTTFGSCTGASALVPFDSTVATAAALGAATSEDRDELISWAKGTNIYNELSKGVTAVRPSVHGDVIHSNPLALSYGTKNDVVVYYGSNDGMLHAVNGNQAGDYLGYKPGAELWAFMPPEFLSKIKVLRDNNDPIKMTPKVGETSTGIAKPYGIDGPISAYRDGKGAAEKTWLFATMRRGGRAVYAFDVSAPNDPKIKWKVGCPNLKDDTDCTTGFTSIGQTWSTPRPIRATGYEKGAAPLLLMGGGYDECEDTEPATCASGKGKNIFVLDAATGAKLAALPTDRGVVGEIRFAPGADGMAMYGYAADLGGNLYRITIGDKAPAEWTITKIAALGCATNITSCTDPRKFMFSPSVVQEPDGSNSIYLGSGDREKPLPAAYFPLTVAKQNYFFKVRDKPASATWLSDESTRCGGVSVLCMDSLNSAGSVAGTCGANMPAESKGYALTLRATEQVVTSAATRFGVTTYSTHMPTVPVPGTCGSNLGKVHVYNLNIATATPIKGTTCADEVTGGGLPPSPVKVDVCMNEDCTDTDPITIGGSKDSPVQTGQDPTETDKMGAKGKRRVYWYIQK